MGATRLVMQGRIQNAYAETGTEYISLAEIQLWIQEAHDLLAETGYYGCTGKTALVANQPNYDLSTLSPALYRLESALFLQDGGTTYYSLTPMPWWRYRQYMDGNETTTTPLTTGVPSSYCVHGTQVWLDPCPSYNEANGLKLYYQGYEILDEDADTTHLPQQSEILVLHYGLWKAFSKDKDAKRAEEHKQHFEQGKLALAVWVETHGYSGPVRMPTDDDMELPLG